MISCGVRLSEVGLSDIRKPQVAVLCAITGRSLLMKLLIKLKFSSLIRCKEMWWPEKISCIERLLFPPSSLETFSHPS